MAWESSIDVGEVGALTLSTRATAKVIDFVRASNTRSVTEYATVRGPPSYVFLLNWKNTTFEAKKRQALTAHL